MSSRCDDGRGRHHSADDHNWRPSVSKGTFTARKRNVDIVVEQRSKGFLLLPFRVLRREDLATIEYGEELGYMGCSPHNVPSLSKVALRLTGGTNTDEPEFAAFSRKTTIRAFFGAVPFHVEDLAMQSLSAGSALLYPTVVL